MYRDKDKERATTKERVKKYRAKQKGVTGVTPRIVDVGDTIAKGESVPLDLTDRVLLNPCPACGGRGFIELEHGLIMKPCSECRK